MRKIEKGKLILTSKTVEMEDITDVNWFFACQAEDIPEDGGACVKIDDQQIAVFNFSRKGKWYATQNQCPHKMQMALSRGMIGSAGEQAEPKVACPFHKMTFSLNSGKCLNGDVTGLKTYPVRVLDNKVYIGI